jgi:tetratricopeptide (TPR) repeat protein
VRQSDPQQFWPHFYAGVCAHRLGKHEQAKHAFDICVALSPTTAECYFNRGLVHSARKQSTDAIRDFDRALELKPKLAVAAANRGLLHYRAGLPAEAKADFKRALGDGLDSAPLHFNLALAQVALKEKSDAADSLRRALQLNPNHADARALLRSLTQANGAD